MNEEENKKLNDQIDFCNSISQQFFSFRDEIKLNLGRLQEEMGRFETGNKELKTLIDANRSWIQICDGAIKTLKASKPAALPPIWKFWK